jgi:GNAT superfamily N-acetyltransferase
VAVTVRAAGPADNAALVALAARCPMNGHVSLCVDRWPDFFALNRLAGAPWRVGVVDGDDGLLACVAVARRMIYVDGRPTPSTYVGDLKVHPGHRRRGLGRALVGWALTAAREFGGPALASVLAGNAAVDRLRPAAPGVVRWTTIRSHSISLLWRRRPAATRLSLRIADPGDGPDMAALWARLAGARQFAPAGPSFPLGEPGLDYLLAHDPDGRLAGFVGLWDQHAVKQVRVTAYSPRLRAARAAVNLTAPLFGAPPLPPPGGILRHRTVAHPCAADPATLATLLRAAANRLRGRYSLLTVGLDTRDPLSGALAGLLAQPTDVDLLVLAGPRPGPAPAHFEIATV